VRRRSVLAALGLAGMVAALPLNAAPTLSVEQMVQAIYRQYPSIRVAELELNQARQEIAKVDSQLGWVLNAQGGYSHELSFIDSPLDRYDASAGVQRTLESGSQLGISGGYTYEENQRTFSPVVANPTERTRIDLDYRMPLSQGKDNPGYHSGMMNAGAQVAISKANFNAAQDRVVQQALSLFYDAAVTRARIDEAKGAIERAERLVKFTRKNQDLGLVEDKDILQAEAQYQSQVSSLRSLEALWERQRITLNRLMGRPFDEEFRPEANIANLPTRAAYESAFAKVVDYSPELRVQRQRITLAQSTITLAQDERKDQVDLILNLGARDARGDSSLGSLQENEVVGGLRVEYRRALDTKGLDAGLYQAHLDQQIAEQQIRRIKQDLKYDVMALLADIQASDKALQSTRKHLAVEKRKWRDALERYQSGRADTDQLIRFENDLNQTRLQYQQQIIELARKRSNLRLLQGDYATDGADAR
jgi:outer membrane protein